jgi:uncharacterized small protein (DUF1192 family)
MKSSQLFEELVEVAERIFAEVRRDEGLFQTGACTYKGRSILLVNTRQPMEERVAAVAREIARAGAEQLYLKPAVRAEVERYAPDAGETGNP